MTSQFVKRNSREFFRDKKAIVLSEQKNIGGEIIAKDEVVIIMHKNQRTITELDVKSDTGVIIYGVGCEDLELVK
jgi:hypothetical protein